VTNQKKRGKKKRNTPFGPDLSPQENEVPRWARKRGVKKVPAANYQKNRLPKNTAKGGPRQKKKKPANRPTNRKEKAGAFRPGHKFLFLFQPGGSSAGKAEGAGGKKKTQTLSFTLAGLFQATNSAGNQSTHQGKCEKPTCRKC